MRVLLYGMLRAEGRRGVSAKRKNGGFTLLEMLLTVAILVILLGLSAVGVARWLHPLKITELDNAAREIYMAAENRVVLLKNSGVAPKRLENADPYPGPVTGTSADGTETPVSLRVLSNTTNTDILNDMLPVGSIDPALREGYFYILYDESTSHVFEVFYAEKPFNKDELNDLRVSRSERVEYYRKDTANHRLVGHYAGGLADKISNKELPKPDVKVEIVNKDELTLTVKYTMPTDLPTGVSVTRKPKVTLKYGDKEITLLDENGNIPSLYSGRITKNVSITDITNPYSATYTWVLDSLVNGSDDKTQRFKDLFDGESPVLGNDFAVTASLELSADDYIGSSKITEAGNNSLFAEDSHNGDIAYIENLRHLQNLDEYSAVTITSSDGSVMGNKTVAIQRATIDASQVLDNEGGTRMSSYHFEPIRNYILQSYTSSLSKEGESSLYCCINNLTIAKPDMSSKFTALFSDMTWGFQMQNVCLVDVDISSSNVAGALIGWTGKITCINCLAKDVTINTSSYAGGLVGGCWDNTESEFKNCLVENVTVNGTTTGGMVGEVPNATFTNCVVRGNIKASGGMVGGLAGGGKESAFINCAVEGNIEVSGKVAGGLVGASESKKRASKFENCHVFTDETDSSAATLKSTDAAGGLVGRTAQAEFIGCTVGNDKKSIDINGESFAGGLLGNPYGGGEVTNCSVKNAKVNAERADSSAGGLVGRIESMGRDEHNNPIQPPAGVTFPIKITNCTVKTIEVEGITNVGGLIGSTENVLFNDCTATDVIVKATSYAGGLTGNSIEDQYTNCQAINASATSTSTAGGLVGTAKAGKFDGCRVYWKDKSKLGSGNNLNYQVSATTSAGGLVGEITEGGTIQNSFAATLVKANSYVGGLVGRLPAMTESVTIKSSYADCYILVENSGWSCAGGLIGIKEANDFQLTLTDVYATGFIEMKESGGMAAGLYSGWATNATATNVYTAMHYTSTDPIYPLAAQPLSQNIKCYWLKYPDIDSITSSQGEARNYDQMKNQNSLNLGSAFIKDPETHPYHLDNDNASQASSYPFPSLKDLPHYGDWLKDQ